jgi:hypothetical protein
MARPYPQRDRRTHAPMRAAGSLDAEYGRLEQRVYGIEQSVSALVQQIERDRSELAAQMGQDRAHFDARFSALQESVNERSKTPWSVLIAAFSLIVTTMVALGTLAYLPIKTQMEDMKVDVARLGAALVPRIELERDWARSEKTIATILDMIHRNQAAIVPRGEHEEKWRGQAARDGDLQRQIDEVRRSFGETYSLREALKTMQERLDRIEIRGR